MSVNTPVVDIEPATSPHHGDTSGGATLDVSDFPAASDGMPPDHMHHCGEPPDRIRILLFAANPLSTERLAIEEEARAITQMLRLSRDRDTFDLITCWAVRPADLLQYLNQYRPHIVHFSGHGARNGQILLSDGGGSGRPVGVAALAELFRIMRDDIRVVLLNACYTGAQAQAINRHVDFVIGTRAPITDKAATVFAATFYSALGFGRTIPLAFDQARTALMVHGLPGHDTPELMTRPSANPHLWCEEWHADARHPATKEAPMNPHVSPTGRGRQSPTGPASQAPSVTALNSGAIVSGHGHVVTTGGTTNINTGPRPDRRLAFDTKMLFAMLIADVAFFLYGMLSYTGANTRADTWRAVIFIVMFGMTAGMIRRWFRRRT